MNSTLTKRNKPWVMCIWATVFFTAMLIWTLLLNGQIFAQWLTRVQDQASDAQQHQKEVEAAVVRAQKDQKSLTDQLTELQSAHQEKEVLITETQAKIDRMDKLPETVMEIRREYGAKVRQLEELIMDGRTDRRICYLTFDDGPNNLTRAIVEKLSKLDVYATFFTIGANSARYQAENLRLEMMGGHTVANHTYSHAYYGPLYSSFEELKRQVQNQDQKVFDATGFHTEIFRFPSGSMACPFLSTATAWLEENNYKWIDWNASGWDSGIASFNAGGRTIAWSVYSTTTRWDIAVVLLHDFNSSTYEGLDIIIEQLGDEGYVFLPLFIESHMFDEPLPVV